MLGSRVRPSWFAGWVAISLATCVSLPAQEPSEDLPVDASAVSNLDAAPTAGAGGDAEAEAVPPEVVEKLKQTVDVGVMLLLLVVVIGVFLLAMVMVGGRAVRRIGRASTPSPQPLDPLWHLRNSGSADSPQRDSHNE